MIDERSGMLPDGSTLRYVSDPGAAVPHRGQDDQPYGVYEIFWSTTRPGNRIVPVGIPRIRKTNGRSLVASTASDWAPLPCPDRRVQLVYSITRTFVAFGPLSPWATSNSTRSPS